MKSVGGFIYDVGAGAYDAAKGVKDGVSDLAVGIYETGADIVNGDKTIGEVAGNAWGAVKQVPGRVSGWAEGMAETYKMARDAGEGVLGAGACAAAEGLLGDVLGLDENAGVREVTKAAIESALVVEGGIGAAKRIKGLLRPGGTHPGITVAEECPKGATAGGKGPKTGNALDDLGKGADDAGKDVGKVKNKGRKGKQARLRELADDPDVSSADRGWIRNEERHIRRGDRKTIRLPGNSRNSPQGGKVLRHKRGKSAKDGHGYEHSDLQDTDLHKLQHKHEGYK